VSGPLAVEPLDAAAFEPFGAVLARPVRDPDATGDGWSWWAEIAGLPADGRGHEFGYLALEPGAASFDWAERHLRSPELVAPLGAPCVVYVARPDDGAAEPAGEFRCFRIEPGQAVLLAPGVWHGAPFAAGRAGSAMVVLAAGTGTSDTLVVRFDPIGVTMEQGG